MIDRAVNRRRLFAHGLGVFISSPVIVFDPVIAFDFDTVSIRRQNFCRRYFFARRRKHT